MTNGNGHPDREGKRAEGTRPAAMRTRFTAIALLAGSFVFACVLLPLQNVSPTRYRNPHRYYDMNDPSARGRVSAEQMDVYESALRRIFSGLEAQGQTVGLTMLVTKVSQESVDGPSPVHLHGRFVSAVGQFDPPDELLGRLSDVNVRILKASECGAMQWPLIKGIPPFHEVRFKLFGGEWRSCPVDRYNRPTVMACSYDPRNGAPLLMYHIALTELTSTRSKVMYGTQFSDVGDSVILLAKTDGGWKITSFEPIR